MPGTFSKSFQATCAHMSCREICHPGLSCIESYKRTLVDGAIGSCKFYLPICLLPLLLKLNKWKSKKFWKRALKDTTTCLLFGYSMNLIALGAICLSYNIFKGFHFPTIIFLPVSLGTMFCYKLPPTLQRIEGQGLLNIYIEFIIRQSRLKWVESFRKSRACGTALFSVLHACVMFGFLKKACKSFWFSSLRVRDASEISDKVNNQKCRQIHGNVPCVSHIKQELKQTAKFAFGIAFAKLLSKIIPKLKTPWQIPRLLITKLDYNLIMFFVSLNAIFKFMFCYLNRSTSNSIEFNCIASSLLSGVGYAFFPRYIVITLAITTAIESIYKCYVKKISETRDKLPKIVEIMNKVPVLPLIFIFSLGMNLQLRFFYPSLINKFMYKISFSATNGHADAIAHRVVGKMMGFD